MLFLELMCGCCVLGKFPPGFLVGKLHKKRRHDMGILPLSLFLDCVGVVSLANSLSVCLVRTDRSKKKKHERSDLFLTLFWIPW